MDDTFCLSHVHVRYLQTVTSGSEEKSMDGSREALPKHLPSLRILKLSIIYRGAFHAAVHHSKMIGMSV